MRKATDDERGRAKELQRRVLRVGGILAVLVGSAGCGESPEQSGAAPGAGLAGGAVVPGAGPGGVAGGGAGSGVVEPGGQVGPGELPEEPGPAVSSPEECGTLLSTTPALPPKSGMRRLSWTEVSHAITDLFPNVSSRTVSTEAADELVPDRETHRLAPSETFFRAYRPAATDIAAQAASASAKGACAGGGADCYKAELLSVASRAWRHNLAASESQLLTDNLTAFQQEIGEQAGYAAALELVLSSPRFLYLLEPGSLATDQATAGVHRATGDRAAGMLAAALWASIPDAPLLAAAAAGRLDEPVGLAAEVQRMMADPRARRGMTTLFRSWLGYRQVEKAFKNDDLFPAFDDTVRNEMVADTDRTLERLFFEEASNPDALLSSSLGFPGENTIKALGWEGISPGQADLSAVGRNGVATHPSILAITSGSDETSIVSRGLYFVETLACGHIPPPPPGVDNDVDKIVEAAGRPLSNREIAERHATEPGCASCHQFLDPFGMVFENYDPIGALRDKSHGVAVDTSVTLAGAMGLNGTYAGAPELLSALAETGTTRRCFATQLANFVKPQKLTKAQSCALAELTVKPDGSPASMFEVVQRFVTSEDFLNRSL